MFFPEIRKGIAHSPFSAGREIRQRSEMLRRSTGDVKGRLLLPAALHRGRDPHGLPVFGNRATRDVDAGMAKLLDDRVVGKNVGGAFAVDQLSDAMPY